MTGAPGTASEDDVLAALEDTVEEGLGELGVVQDGAPLAEGFVGGEDEGPALEAALVDDPPEEVCGVVGVVEVADLVDDEDVGLNIFRSDFAELAVARCLGEVVDEVGCGGAAGVEAVLNGAVCDGDGEVGFSAAGWSRQDQVAAFSDELGAEVGAEPCPTDAGLEGEVELLDGLEEGDCLLYTSDAADE